jgi:proline iminopeptidase
MSPDGGTTADRFAPLTTQMLPVGDGHTLYVETIGNARGTPMVFLHGGPGSGSQPSHRELFDPATCNAVLFDQRGAGRSTPLGERRANTTAHQIADIELIRETLGIERWVVVGGSWGATLGLAYAEMHPERVTGLILRATFLGTRGELELAFGANLQRLYPDLWADFVGVLPAVERSDHLTHYWRRILDPDPAIHRPAAIAWHDTERILSVAHPTQTRLDPAAVAATAGPLPRSPFMEAWYFARDCFLRPGQLLEEAGRLRSVPSIIVQGELDHLCPPPQAEALARLWPKAELQIVPDAGHSLGEPAIAAAVRAAIARFA